MKTLLVTGGAGFIGGNFVLRQIARQQCRVINLDSLSYAGNLETLAAVENHPDHEFVLGSIADKELVEYLLERHAVDAVVNFAAETHVDRSIDSPEAFVQTNVVGTFQLLEAARWYWHTLDTQKKADFRVLHVSTDEVFGSLGPEGYFSETSPYQPNSPYSASKAASDHLVRAYFHTYGLPVLTTNCSNNYGPYQFPEKLIPLIIQNARAGKPLPVYGEGSNIRDWLYVEDHCRAIETVLEAGKLGEVYTIGGHNEKTNLQVVEKICELLDAMLPDSPHVPHRQLIHFVKDRPGHDMRYAIDASRMKNELGWLPEESFETGLYKTVQWYLEHDDWITGVTEGNYRGERLGLRET